MRFFASPHTHVESPISGSTLDSMVKEAVRLGRTHFSYTDPNYLTSAYRAYEASKKNKLKFIPGVEVYFKDFECDIIKGTKSDKAKYFRVTLHATDQEAYQKICSLSSIERPNVVTSYGNDYQLWSWADLEQCRGFNILACTGDVHDVVTKHLITGAPQLSLKIMERMLDIFGDRFYLTVVGNSVERVWESFVVLKYQDGTSDTLFATDKVRTNAAKMGLQAKEIPEKIGKHNFVSAYTSRGRFVKVEKKLNSAKVVSGFVKIPGSDPQLTANKLVMKLSKMYDVPVIYSDYAFYATRQDKMVQDVRLSADDIRDHTMRHMQSGHEATEYMTQKLGLTLEEACKILETNTAWASSFDQFELKYDYRMPKVDDGQDPLKLAMDIINENGRMKWDDKAYVERLTTEIKVLSKNGKIDLLPYFFPIRGVLNNEKKNGRIIGPGRGSAAGSLFMYLMGITEVDPLKYDLSFERFLSLDRVLTGNLPDVDVDLIDRSLLVGEDGRSGYLYGKYGACAAQISTRTNLRLKSAIKDVCRHFHGAVDPDTEKLSKSLPSAPQGVSDIKFVFGYEDDDGNRFPGLIEINEDLIKYSEQRPLEWDVVVRCLGISRQNSKHASAFVIADRPISDIVPMFMGGNVTQYEAKGVESAKLIKYDFLVVNQLADIQKCIELINSRSGYVPVEAGHFLSNGEERFIWNLPEEQEVFNSVYGGQTETVFQLHTRSMIPFVVDIRPETVIDVATIQALVRPGPLDFVDPETGLNMAEEYVERRKGRGTVKLPELAALLPETYGVQVFQEQTSKVSRSIGKMKPTDAEELRRVFSKKDKIKALSMKSLFMACAVEEVGKEKAEMIWAQMETSSRYSFNKSHAVSYGLISYACMYLKHHFPQEWWAAVLTNATEQEITNVLYKYVRDKVSPPDINLSGAEMKIDYDNNKIVSKLGVLKGLGDSAVEAIVAGRPYKDIKDFAAKKVAGPSLTKKLIVAGVMDSLFPKDTTLINKLYDYEVAVKTAEYEFKIKNGKKPKPLRLSEISVDEKYIGMKPLAEFLEKKSILPTLPFSLYSLIIKNKLVFNEGTDRSPMISNRYNVPTLFIRGEKAQAADWYEVTEDSYYCTPAYVIEMKEFAYKKNTRKALKMTLDHDGYIVERVLWPDYESGELIYPDNLKAGKAIVIFLKRRPPKDGREGPDLTQICEIKVLDENA